jgi:hypothetical protein
MNYRCPVCFFPRLPYPPADYHICPCCGTEFENDDRLYSHEQLRERWIANGAHWFFGDPPENWNPWKQLAEGGVGISNKPVSSVNANDLSVLRDWGNAPPRFSVTSATGITKAECELRRA